MPLALNSSAVVKRTQMMKMWLRRRRPSVIIDETRTSHGKKSIESRVRILIQMITGPSRRRLNQPVPTARKTPPLVVMERTGAQHWEEHVMDAAKKDT